MFNESDLTLLFLGCDGCNNLKIGMAVERTAGFETFHKPMGALQPSRKLLACVFEFVCTHLCGEVAGATPRQVEVGRDQAHQPALCPLTS